MFLSVFNMIFARFFSSSRSIVINAGLSLKYSNILVENRGRVALVTLNRPKALNALNTPLMLEVLDEN